MAGQPHIHPPRFNRFASEHSRFFVEISRENETTHYREGYSAGCLLSTWHNKRQHIVLGQLSLQIPVSFKYISISWGGSIRSLPGEPASSAGSGTFFSSLKCSTSTSKAVACAVISIAGSVSTQPTAQTTTSASTGLETNKKQERKNSLKEKMWGKNGSSWVTGKKSRPGRRRPPAPAPLLLWADLKWEETPPKKTGPSPLLLLVLSTAPCSHVTQNQGSRSSTRMMGGEDRRRYSSSLWPHRSPLHFNHSIIF